MPRVELTLWRQTADEGTDTHLAEVDAPPLSPDGKLGAACHANAPLEIAMAQIAATIQRLRSSQIWRQS